MTWSPPLIFALFLKGKQNKKKKKKTLSVTPCFGKTVCEKPDRVRGSGYLSGRYSKKKNRSTLLSP